MLHVNASPGPSRRSLRTPAASPPIPPASVARWIWSRQALISAASCWQAAGGRRQWLPATRRALTRALVLRSSCHGGFPGSSMKPLTCAQVRQIGSTAPFLRAQTFFPLCAIVPFCPSDRIAAYESKLVLQRQVHRYSMLPRKPSLPTWAVTCDEQLRLLGIHQNEEDARQGSDPGLIQALQQAVNHWPAYMA